ncbi:MAG: hypothetical protein F6J93_37160 [Oscillatoria sp. SIO1A7]|nr:hypothetical protein [Oscillatoria sp. SIO1A7]
MASLDEALGISNQKPPKQDLRIAPVSGRGDFALSPLHLGLNETICVSPTKAKLTVSSHRCCRADELKMLLIGPNE